MTDNHNWNQFHKMLIKLGFFQTSNYDNQYLYYRSPLGDIITIKKDNNYPTQYVEAVLRKIGVDYDIFVKLYSSDKELV